MKKGICLLMLTLVSSLFGCSEDPPPATTTTVNVQSYLMDAEAFDMASVVAKLKEGNIQNAEDLQKFINETPGINNVDLDKDGSIDIITVKEERGENGRIAMAVVAHPKDESRSATVAELAFEKSASGQVVVEGSYPNYVQGHEQHYYRHTLTGSMIGDMMFYSWLFSPRPVFYHPYRYGMYGYHPRPVLRGPSLHSTRTTYRSTNKVTSVSPVRKPSSYKPSTSSAQKTASKIGNRPSTTSNTLKSKAGATKSFSTTTQPKTTAKSFGASRPSPSPRPAPRPSPSPRWGSSSRSFGGSSRSFGSSSRRSSAAVKQEIEYLSQDQVAEYAEQVQNIPLTTWRYNDIPNDKEHLGFILEDMGGAVCSDEEHGEVDLYSYTSMTVAAIQMQAQQIEALSREVNMLRDSALTCQ